jgi:hypothetical protein
MYKKSAPTTSYAIEMIAVKRNTWADNFHIERTIMSQRLARTEWDTVLSFKYNLLIKQKIHQFFVRGKFETQWPDNLIEKILQSFFSRFSI